MALTKQEKDEVVVAVKELLTTSKMTVVAKYQGTPVKAMQQLRRDAGESGTKVKVVKNRLLMKALEQTESLKGIDKSPLEGMLLYAFNSDDEVAPAQSLHAFAKSNPSIEFVGAISNDGKWLAAEDVKALAVLPGKNQLVAELIATLLSPVHDITNGLSGNLHALLDGVAAKAA